MTDPERLQRRLAREREARRAAEQIAETTARRLYDRSQAVDLLNQVAAAANAAQDSATAFRRVLSLLLEFTSFRVGHAFRPDPADPTTLVSADIWVGPESEFRTRVERATRDMVFPLGAGLPGTVMAKQQPWWIPDFDASLNFPRQKQLTGGSAMAFPVVVGTEVVAVLELLSPVPSRLDELLLELLGTVGSQLGQVVERERAQRAEREYARRLERRVAERTRELTTAMDRAETANDEKSDFIAAVSHELRTPLQTVMGILELAKRDDAPPLMSRSDRATAHAAAAALAERIDRLIAVATLESRSGSDGRSPVDLGDMVRSYAAARSAGSDPVPVTVEIPASPVLAGGHGGLLSLLIEESLEALLTTGTTELLVHLKIDREDRPPKITLRATAVHAATERAADATRADADSSGPPNLDLALARHVAALLGGSVQPSSSPHGPVLTLELPTAGPAPAEAASAEQAGSAAQGSGGRPRTVLLVEDNAVNRALASALLRTLDVEVTEATDGEAALEELHRRRFGLVLMDINLPGKNGMEIARQWRTAGINNSERASDPQVPIVAVTALSAAQDVQDFRDSGMNGYLGKPFTRDALQEVLDRFLPSRGAPGA